MIQLLEGSQKMFVCLLAHRHSMSLRLLWVSHSDVGARGGNGPLASFTPPDHSFKSHLNGRKMGSR